MDDKLELMITLQGIVPHLFFFQTPEKAASMVRPPVSTSSEASDLVQASGGHTVAEYRGEFTHCTSWAKIFDLIVSSAP